MLATAASGSHVRRGLLGAARMCAAAWWHELPAFLLVLLALAVPCAAADSDSSSLSILTDKMYTSTAAYCAQPGALLVEGFSLRFYRANNTMDFELSAAAVAKNTSASANLHVYAYGLDVYELDLNLCDISETLCPLPQYNFTGGGTYQVPPDISTKVPAIAYRVLDIEALVELSLTEQRTNATLACLQVTLSNGHTARQLGVTWGAVALTALGAASSLVHTSWTDSLGAMQWRITDLVRVVQLPAFVSMLTLLFPEVYHQYSLNFAWSLGLIFIESIQSSVLSTRVHTGSYDQRGFSFNSQLFEQIKAQMIRFSNLFAAKRMQTGPRNRANGASLFPKLMQHAGSGGALARRATSALARRAATYAPNTGPGGEMDPGQTKSSIVEVSRDSDFQDLGILYYVSNLAISPLSMFFTVLVIWLLACCMVIGAFMLGFIVRNLCYRWLAQRPPAARLAGDKDNSAQESGRPPIPDEVHLYYRQVMRPALFHFLEVATPVLLVAIFYQWAHSRSWVAHFLAAILLAFLLASWLSFLVPVFRHVARTRNVNSLYYGPQVSPWDAHTPALRIVSPVHPWRPRCFWFPVVVVLCDLIRACFISFPQGASFGLRQSVGLAAVDGLLFLALCILRPGRDKSTDFVQIMLCLFRIVTWALCIALTIQANVWGIPRAVLGYVLLGVTALAMVFMFFVVLWDTVSPLLIPRQRWSGKFGSDPQQDSRAEKGATDWGDAVGQEKTMLNGSESSGGDLRAAEMGSASPPSKMYASSSNGLSPPNGKSLTEATEAIPEQGATGVQQPSLDPTPAETPAMATPLGSGQGDASPTGMQLPTQDPTPAETPAMATPLGSGQEASQAEFGQADATKEQPSLGLQSTEMPSAAPPVTVASFADASSQPAPSRAAGVEEI